MILCCAQGQSKDQKLLPNPQTDELLSLLGLDHVVTVPCPGWQPPGASSGSGVGVGGGDSVLGAGRVGAGGGPTSDPCEIDLDAARQDPNEIQLDM